MTGRVDGRLRELDIVLPEPIPPVATYVPYVLTGSLVFLSGQVTVGPNGLEYLGQVGADFSVEEGQTAARLCAINILAQLKEACDGDLDRVTRCVKLGGFVNAPAGFKDHPKVINGASDLMVDVFGDAGRHARFAVGSGSLPLNVAVEVEAVFEIA